jgi:hypothetical protein
MGGTTDAEGAGEEAQMNAAMREAEDDQREADGGSR